MTNKHLYFAICESAPTTYPLSNISTSANRAYSIRKVRGAYSGNAIKLRRSSDNATTDVAFLNGVISGSSTVSAGGNLTTWAGADNLFVDTWYDQSVNSIDATQSTLSAQPIFILNGGSAINNLPVLRCTGSQYLGIGSPVSSEGNFTWAFVQGNLTDRAVVNRIMDCVRAADNLTLFAIVNSATEQLRTIYYNNVGGAILDLSGGSIVGSNFTQYLVLAEDAAVLTGTNFEKGTQIGTGSSAAAWTNANTYLRYELFAHSRLVSFYIGDFCEMFYFTAGLSSTERNVVTQSQRNFFKLP